MRTLPSGTPRPCPRQSVLARACAQKAERMTKGAELQPQEECILWAAGCRRCRGCGGRGGRVRVHAVVRLRAHTEHTRTAGAEIGPLAAQTAAPPSVRGPSSRCARTEVRESAPHTHLLLLVVPLPVVLGHHLVRGFLCAAYAHGRSRKMTHPYINARAHTRTSSKLHFTRHAHAHVRQLGPPIRSQRRSTLPTPTQTPSARAPCSESAFHFTPMALALSRNGTVEPDATSAHIARVSRLSLRLCLSVSVSTARTALSLIADEEQVRRQRLLWRLLKFGFLLTRTRHVRRTRATQHDGARPRPHRAPTKHQLTETADPRD